MGSLCLLLQYYIRYNYASNFYELVFVSAYSFWTTYSLKCINFTHTPTASLDLHITVFVFQERAGVKMILIQDASQGPNMDKPLRIIGDPYKVQVWQFSPVLFHLFPSLIVFSLPVAPLTSRLRF